MVIRIIVPSLVGPFSSLKNRLGAAPQRRGEGRIISAPIGISVVRTRVLVVAAAVARTVVTVVAVVRLVTAVVAAKVGAVVVAAAVATAVSGLCSLGGHEHHGRSQNDRPN